MSETELSVREVAHGSAAYQAMVAIRQLVLRDPLGLRFSAEELDAERDWLHMACYRGEEIVGCLALRPRTEGDVQMKQAAVAPELQGQGIGRALVQFAEDLARAHGFRRMILHARETAVPFYEKLGYSRHGERFEEVTLPHWAMEKPLAGD